MNAIFKLVLKVRVGEGEYDFESVEEFFYLESNVIRALERYKKCSDVEVAYIVNESNDEIVREYAKGV